MANVRTKGVVAEQASGTSYTVNFVDSAGVQQTAAANELILLMLHQKTGYAVPTPSGYTAIGTANNGTGASTGSRQSWFRKVAAGGETSVTFTGLTSDRTQGTWFIVSDADTTTPIDGWQRTDHSNVANKASNAPTASSMAANATLTPSQDDCLLIYSSGFGANTLPLRLLTDDVVVQTAQFAAGGGFVTGYRQQSTAAAVTSITGYFGATNSGGNIWCIAIRNKTNGNRAVDVRTGYNELNWYGQMGNKSGTTAPTWTKLSTFAADGTWTTTPGGLAASATLPSISSAGAGFFSSTWFDGPTSFDITENSAGIWSGGWYSYASNQNMSGKIFSVSFIMDTTGARFGSLGIAVAFQDNVGAWAMYQLAPKSAISANTQYTAQVAPGNGTALASNGSVDWTNIARIAYLYHRTGSTVGDSVFGIWNETLFGTSTITGGSTGNTASFVNLHQPLNVLNFTQMTALQSSAQNQVKGNVQIGDGSNKTIFDASASSTEFPATYATTGAFQTQMLWNVPASIASITVKASANDNISLNACVIAASVNQSFVLDPGFSTSATFTTSGLSLVGMPVTWKSGVSSTGMTLKNAGIHDLKGGTFTNLVVSGGTGTALATVSTGFTDTNGTYTASSTAVYGLRIAAAGTYNLNGTTFSGSFTKHIDVTAPAVNTNAGAFVVGRPYTIAVVGTTDFTLIGASANTVGVTFTATGVGSGSGNANETVLINLAAGTSTPTYQTAGATVNIVSAPVFQTVTISGLVAGSRVQIYDTTSGTQLANATPTSGSGVTWSSGNTVATWTDASPASASRAIRLRVAYQSGTSAKTFIDQNIGTCGTLSSNNAVSYLANQTDDSVYNANALDGSTITGVTISVGPSRVSINVVAGTMSIKSIYAYQVYWQFTATGIAQETAFINAPDTANYILTTFKIKNTGAGALTITDGWYRDSVTGHSVDCTDTTGGSIFPDVEHVVPYATGGSALTTQEHNQLMGIPVNPLLTNDSRLGSQSDSIAANVIRMNSVTVKGTGVSGDLWRG